MSSPQPPTDTVSASSHEHADPRLARWEQRFFWPVIIASVAAIPAMFLAMLDGPAAIAGEVVNYATMLVFAAETVVLLALAGDKRRWVREHWVIVAITLATIPAVILALGPVQVLRLLRFVRALGALRIIRVGRILKAGKILYKRSGLTGIAQTALAIAVTVLAATFVAIVLSDEESESRQVLEAALERVPLGWPIAVVAAGLIIGAATFVVARFRGDDENG